MKFKIDVCVEVLLNFENVDSGADFPPFKNSFLTIPRGIRQAKGTKLTLSLNFRSSLRVYYTANNFGLMYSRKRISQNSFPNFIYIFPKSFMIFCQEL
jgi:hypothetical protein